MARTRMLTLLTLLALAFGTACSVKLAPRIPSDPGSEPSSHPVQMEQEVRGMPTPIGHGTFTLFAIKIAPVRISNGSAPEVFMEQIHKTFEAAGFRVVSAADDSAPTVECVVKKFNFKNYTWLFPIVPTWGGIDIDLRLTHPEGRRLWQESYSGGSWNLWYSFSSAVNSSTEEVLEAIFEDITGSEFQQACCGADASE